MRAQPAVERDVAAGGLAHERTELRQRDLRFLAAVRAVVAGRGRAAVAARMRAGGGGVRVPRGDIGGRGRCAAGIRMAHCPRERFAQWLVRSRIAAFNVWKCGMPAVVAIAAFAAAHSAAQRDASPETRSVQPPPVLVAPFVTTPMTVVDEMLSLAGVGPDDVVVDLGSGDGRLVLAAVTKFGARAGFGVDIDPNLVDYANRKAQEAGVATRVQFSRATCS